MTPQEALNRIDGLIANEKLFIKISTMGEIDHSKNIEALEIAKQALEKQIPRKVVRENEKVMFKVFCGRCPECDVAVYSTTNRYCQYCGQALDWG